MKTKKRYLSDAYVDKTIAKIDEIYEKCTGRNVIVTPDCLMSETRFGGPGRLSERERKEIKEYYKQLQNLSFVRGFWTGYSLRDGIKESHFKLINRPKKLEYMVNL